MKIEINFDDIALGDWLDYDPNEEDAPTLKEIFREEIKEAFIKKLNYDYSIKRYIENEIQRELYTKMLEVKDDAVITALVKECIADYVSLNGSALHTSFLKSNLDKAKEKIREEITPTLNSCKKELSREINAQLKEKISDILKDLYKNDVIGQFLDVPKLSRHILETLTASEVKDD